MPDIGTIVLIAANAAIALAVLYLIVDGLRHYWQISRSDAEQKTPQTLPKDPG